MVTFRNKTSVKTPSWQVADPEMSTLGFIKYLNNINT